MSARRHTPQRALVVCALVAAPGVALADGPDGGAPPTAPDGGVAASDASAAETTTTTTTTTTAAPTPAAQTTTTTSLEPARPAAPPAAAAAPEASAPASVVAPPAARRVGRRRAGASAEPAAPREQEIFVVSSSTRALDRLGGSYSVIRREDLRMQSPQHAGDALRNVPGINVVSEDGMGLRLNISVRGLDPNRSRKVLILEDGLPVSLNPYGAPELYYSPPIERMDRVEVVRGSGQILWGPQTIGGVINYVTREPPRTPMVFADLRYGSYGYLLAHAAAGATHGAVGWRLDVIHRRFDGPRRLDVAVVDVNARLRLQLAPRSVLNVRLNFYDEGSRATYIGPTTPQYQHDPTINLAENDRMSLRRYAIAATHQHRFTSDVALTTGFYAYQTTRAWRRQEFDREDMGADYERVCDGLGRCGAPGEPGVATSNDRGSVFFRRSSAIRDRAFGVVGIEPRLTWNWRAPRVLAGEFSAMVRVHHETARDALLVTSFPTARSGESLNDELRNGYALAAAVQNRFSFWNRLHITPGVRVENFWSDRRVTRVPVMVPGGGTRGGDVDQFGNAFSWALIPGIGASVNVLPEAPRQTTTAQQLTIYTGLHRGYAPPRTRDAITPAGTNLQLDPELSWNTELGARLRLARWLNVDVAGFWLEFENQIIPPSESGAVVSGGMFNTGHSRHVGAEASATFDIAPLLRTGGFTLPLTVNYTWLPMAAFVGGLFNDFRLPYAPEHLLYTQLRFTHAIGLSAQVGLNFVSSQFADKENTVAPSADGLVGQVPSYLTLDARVAYTWRRAGLTFSFTGRNLTDQVYIASRAPQGIQPAGWRQFFFGVEWAWPGT